MHHVYVDFAIWALFEAFIENCRDGAQGGMMAGFDRFKTNTAAPASAPVPVLFFADMRANLLIIFVSLQ